MHDRQPAPQLSLLRRIVFSLLPLLTLLLAAEIILRVGPFDFEVAALDVQYSGVHTTRMFQIHITGEHFIRDAVTFWRPKPAKRPFNDAGYRGEMLSAEKAPGEFRILAMGDSNTLGHAAAWANLLPSFIDPAAVGAETVTVINAGVYGYTSFQGQHHLERFIDYDPDVVLISYGGNEASPNTVEDKAYKPYQPPWIYRFFDHKLAIVNFIEAMSVKLAAARRKTPAAVDGETTDDPPSVNRVSIADYGLYLNAMIDRVQATGAVPILLTRPMIIDYHQEGVDNPLKPYYHATLEAAAARGVGLIDVDVLANHAWTLFDDHSHFNAAGHEVIARAMGTALVQLLDGKPYDLAALQYRSRNAEERMLNILGKTLSKWRDLDENIAVATRRRMIEAITAVHDTRFAGTLGGWDVEVSPSKAGGQRLEADGGLCFAERPRLITLTHRDLSLARDTFHIAWAEAESRSDVTLRMFWSDALDAPFDNARSAVASFFGDQSDLPIRFFYPLPPGTQTVRLAGDFTRWEGDFCLRRIYLGEVKTKSAKKGKRRQRAEEKNTNSP